MKKWNGFFMPETIKMLKDVWQYDHKTPRPHLDETKIEEVEPLLSESMDTKMLLEITTWGKGFFTSSVGFVTKIDQNEFESLINLDFFSITNVIIK
jgi:hypothetical protein